MRTLTAIVLALALLLAGCGDDDAGDAGDDVRTAPLVFGDGDEVLLRVETGGGFVPVIHNLRQVPDVLLFDDGRLVRRTSDPGAVVPTFAAARLDEFETAALVEATTEVIEGPDVGTPGVTDLPTTSLTLTADGGERRLDVYALGVDDVGLDDRERAARAAVSDLLDELGAAGDAEPFVPEQWLALTTASLEGADVTEARDWPLAPERAADASSPAVCTRLAGDDVELVRSTLEGDDQGFVATGTTVVEIALRPVLTGDETCNLGGADDFVER